MFAKSLFTILPLFSAISTLVSADVVPTSPDGSTVVKIGDKAEALWAKDSNGTWTDVTVKLMTGDNFNMIEVTTLAENVDGTSATSLEWTVPEVSPTSHIYFLQFTPADLTITPQWTTRFTIAAADGSTSEPTNSTQPGGASIPWGIGMLVGGNSTTPSTSSNSTSAMTSSSSSAVSSSSSSSSAASASMTTSVRAAAAASESASSVASSASRSASNSASAASASATSGATTVRVAGGLVALVGFVAGFMAI